MGRSEQGSVALAALLGVPLGVLLAFLGAAVGMALLFAGGQGCATATAGEVEGVPARLVPIYRRASSRYGLGARGPAVLAAINKIETGFGANTGTSSAGAQGWMQFIPSTWAAYGVDADGDGIADPHDPWDAIFAAARYLRASGAPEDWAAAIFAYNHADWYVAEVLADARRFAASGAEVASAGLVGCAAAATDSEALARMIAEAERIDTLRLDYVWGGSHGRSPTPPNGPFDCSSAVSHLLQVGGFGNPTMTTVGLAAWGEPGPGRLLTIHVKPHGPEAHVLLEFAPGLTPPARRYWGTSRTNPKGGPGWISESEFSKGYVAGFQRRHPEGM